MTSTALTALFDGLLDDAAMFPPEDAPLADAVVGHAAHRLAWYSDLVASFVCAAGRLPSLSAQLAVRAIPRLSASLVVPAGIDAVPDALAAASRVPRLRSSLWKSRAARPHCRMPFEPWLRTWPRTGRSTSRFRSSRCARNPCMPSLPPASASSF